MEVRPDEATRVGRGVDIDRHTLAKAEFTVITVGIVQTGKAAQQQAVTLEYRIDFPAIAVGVAFVGEITFVPGIAHGCSLLNRNGKWLL
ncbi:hypothetical protein D3C81_1881380 [compost metagenome]